MIIGMEIGLLIAGLYALVTGKLTVTRNRVVYGAAARCLGLVALLPFPLMFGIGFIMGAQMAARGEDPSALANNGALIALEAGTVIVCAVVFIGLGLMLAGPPPSQFRSQNLDDELFRLAHPDRFGGGPPSASAYQQGATRLQTMALFEDRAPGPGTWWPGRRRPAAPSCAPVASS